VATLKILFFAPHSAAWVHAFPEALVAESLQQSGHEIVYITCGRQLDRLCIPMLSHGMHPGTPQADKARICDRCDAVKHLLRESMQLRGYDMATMVNAEDEARAQAIVQAMRPEAVHTLEVEGLQVGRLALYQLILRHKLIDLEFSPQQWEEYLDELRNALYALFACTRILDREQPHRVLVYNALYSVNRVCCQLAGQRDIPHYFLHAGGNLSNRLQTLMVGRGDTYTFLPHVISQWPRYSAIPCSKPLLERVTEHYLELLRGRSVFVYSQGKSLDLFSVRAYFGVSSGQSLLVATMGSYDEEVAAETVGARRHPFTPLFPTQVDWIRALLEFVRGRSDLFLVIRVHPREFPNRRDARKSQHAVLLEKVLQELPSNAKVNWPADGISMYDFADETDVFLNSWSSVGKEMSLFGVPVVLYSRELPLYPAELNYLGTTREAYFAAIDRALQDGWSAERIRMTFRWGVLEFSRSTVFIGDSYAHLEHPRRSLARKIADRVQVRLDPLFRERRDLRRRQPRLGVAAQIDATMRAAANSVLEVEAPDAQSASEEHETAALRHEVQRLADALYPTPNQRSKSRLYARLMTFSQPSAPRS
jgi:hypothetical protein